jgi:hypothetical protein
MENRWSGCQYCEIILELDLIKGTHMLDVRLSFCACIDLEHSIQISCNSFTKGINGCICSREGIAVAGSRFDVHC